MRYIKITSTFLVFAAFALLSFTAHSASYKFDWTYDGQTTTGYFNGTENGNRITGVTLESLYLDNELINPNGGSWYSSSNFMGLGFTTTDGWLSFDGEDNNVVFADTDYPTVLDYRTQFFSLTFEEYTNIYLRAETRGFYLDKGMVRLERNNTYATTPDVSDWRVTRVPEPGMLWLIASGLASLRCFRRSRV